MLFCFAIVMFLKHHQSIAVSICWQLFMYIFPICLTACQWRHLLLYVFQIVCQSVSPFIPLSVCTSAACVAREIQLIPSEVLEKMSLAGSNTTIQATAPSNSMLLFIVTVPWYCGRRGTALLQRVTLTTNYSLANVSFTRNRTGIGRGCFSI